MCYTLMMDSIEEFAKKIEAQRRRFPESFFYDDKEKHQIQAYFMQKKGWTSEEQEIVGRYAYLEDEYQRIFHSLFIEEIDPALRAPWALTIATQVSLDVCLSFTLESADDLLALQPKIVPILNQNSLKEWLMWAQKMYGHRQDLNAFIDRYATLSSLQSEKPIDQEGLHFALHNYTQKKTYETTKSQWHGCQELLVIEPYTSLNGLYYVADKLFRKMGYSSWHSDMVKILTMYNPIQFAQHADMKRLMIQWLPLSSYGVFKKMCHEKDIFDYYQWPLTYRLLDGQLKRLQSILGEIPYDDETSLMLLVEQLRGKNKMLEENLYL